MAVQPEERPLFPKKRLTRVGVTEGKMGSGDRMKDRFCQAGEAEKLIPPKAPFPPWATQTRLGSGRLALQSIFKTTHL